MFFFVKILRQKIRFFLRKKIKKIEDWYKIKKKVDSICCFITKITAYNLNLVSLSKFWKKNVKTEQNQENSIKKSKLKEMTK